MQTYLSGKISTLDLNDSRVSKDEALRQYIDRLYLYWYYTYQLRSVTLWDFVKDSGIDADFERRGAPMNQGTQNKSVIRNVL